MKKYLLLILVAVTGLVSSCGKSGDNGVAYDAVAQAAADDIKIQAYIKGNNIAAVKDPTGIYYQVITPGTGPYPTISSNVTVNYNGKLLDGTTFDSNTNTSFPLSGVIIGWQYGIPHINMGGRLRLIVPSTLGYRNVATGPIPVNSVLDFTIDLIKF